MRKSCPSSAGLAPSFSVVKRKIDSSGIISYTQEPISYIPTSLSSNFFVTLEEISVFLCIKAVWGIEEKQGYDLETVLNSTFCYKLLSMNT